MPKGESAASGRKFYMLQKTNDTVSMMEAASATMVGRVNRRVLSYTDTIRGVLRFTAANYDFVQRTNPRWGDDQAALEKALKPFAVAEEEDPGKKFYMIEKTPETVALVQGVGALLFGRINVNDASYTEIMRASLRFVILNFELAAQQNPGWINDEQRVRAVIQDYLPNRLGNLTFPQVAVAI